MLFSGFNFDFGKVHVSVASVNTEKGNATVNIGWQAMDMEWKVTLHSGSNWQQLRSWSAEIGAHQIAPPYEPEPDEPEIDWEADEESEEDA